jgi:hypothetical protein
VTSRAVFLAALVITAVVLAALASSRAVLLTNDGGQHLYAWVAALHPDDARRFGDYVVANQSPTARGPREIFTLLEPLLGWERAFRAAVACVALLWAAAFVVLVVTIAPRRRGHALLALPLALQGSFFYGFLPFLTGTALVMLAWSAWLSSKERPRSAARCSRWSRSLLPLGRRARASSPRSRRWAPGPWSSPSSRSSRGAIRGPRARRRSRSSIARSS